MNALTIQSTEQNSLSFAAEEHLNGLCELLYLEAESTKKSVELMHNQLSKMDILSLNALGFQGRNNLKELEESIRSINSAYWVKLFTETKLANYIDTNSFHDWAKLLEGDATPEFSLENIKEQTKTFIGDLPTMFSKRVSQIFEKLSSTHVTNSKSGFKTRMIIDNCSAHDITSEYQKGRYIHDLRAVVHCIQGHETMPTTNSSSRILNVALTKTRVWHEIDGGTMRIKGHKNRTLHIEVEEGVANKMNMALATLYPNCLPVMRKQRAAFKSTLKPVHTMVESSIRNYLTHVKSDNVLEPAKDARNGGSLRNTKRWNLVLRLVNFESLEFKGASQLLNSLFGDYSVDNDGKTVRWDTGDIDAKEVIDHIVMNGQVPEAASHQLYESTERVQEYVKAALSEINVNDSTEYCEPSAGRGKLAKLLPVDQTQCIELDAMNCSFLRGQKYNVLRECFLHYANKTNDRYDVFVMNPPYLKGLYLSHLKAAMSLLKLSGKIVAVVPNTVKSKLDSLPSGFDVKINREFKETFEGTGELNVAIITITKLS